MSNTDYKVITAKDYQELMTRVNMQITIGWTPLGGVAVAAARMKREIDIEWAFAQAMTRQRTPEGGL